MTLPLNPTRLELIYDFLCECPPFDSWNMPPGDDVSFRLNRSNTARGWYNRINGRHVISISTRCCGWTKTVVEVMAHEMVHLHQADVGMETPHAEHNKAFMKLAATVCKFHGFDPHLF